jgi:hypothetical protein
MYDVTASWTKSATGSPTNYTVAWSHNGTVVTPTVVPQSTVGDASGYGADFGTSNPTVTLAPGDTVSATCTAIDTVNNLSSTPVAASVTIPTAPVAPSSPVGFALAVTGP